ncbi:MAG: biopolymer transporter ExbD [Gammaproteobacteria bacterium]|nr:biopolymer transporter ExbD [Gammaproteobacteria bacterium]
MAMSVGSSSEEQLNSTINTTPLVDVMLVLLIIFLITIPVITKTVKVSLPKAANIATQTKPENITVAVDSQGNIYWNNEQVASRDQLIEMIKIEAVKDPQPEIHIRGDANARFEDIGKVIYSVQRGGIVKVGFITEPDRGIRGSR